MYMWGGELCGLIGTARDFVFICTLYPFFVTHPYRMHLSHMHNERKTPHLKCPQCGRISAWNIDNIDGGASDQRWNSFDPSSLRGVWW